MPYRLSNAWFSCFLACVGLLCAGCSMQRTAFNMIGDAMVEGGSVFESDDDLILVGEALPFSLKMLEMLLAESPNHQGLLLAACRGFSTYAYVYVQPEAERIEYEDFQKAVAIRERARRLYLRAGDYCNRGLAVALGTGPEALHNDPAGTLSGAARRHVPLLYWNAVALGLAVSVSKGDAAMLARLPEVDALVGRALELDESWDEGALHELSITLAAARTARPPRDEVAGYFERALELSGGRRASLYVTYAEASALPWQEEEAFRSLLEQALAVDPDQDQDKRLLNIVARERARWLLDHVDDLILAGAQP